jgi:outer membrane biosynthesis protein TonB
VSSSISLTSAVTSGDEKAVSASLADGADVNERTSGGQTPLILAVIFGHTHLVKLLVKAGADPQQRDKLGLNAIDWAQRRGSAEALQILANGSGSNAAPGKIVINIEEPVAEKAAPQPSQPAPDTEGPETISEAEKSRRWIAGFKQRLDEQAMRRLNRNEPPLQPQPVFAQPEPEPQPQPEPEPEPEPPAPEPPRSEPEPAKTEPVRAVHTSRILTPPPQVESGKRKRCPQCNEIYNGDLVSYCAHHIVPLVDADDPIISEPPKSNLPLFWIIVIVTFTGSIVLGSLITTYLYKSNQAAARAAADQQKVVQKGVPEVGGELAGKSVSLPEAECPVKGPGPVTGTVTVRIMVDKAGQVYWARGSGGDWLMRGAATEAAMKSTFAPEKLRGHETEGTITYTFKP